MRKTVLASSLVLGLYSCNKAPQPFFTKEQIKQKADSISSIRIQQADEQAKTDLEYRMKIEVKVKVDSILNARLKATSKDTAKKPKIKVPAHLPVAPKMTDAGKI